MKKLFCLVLQCSASQLCHRSGHCIRTQGYLEINAMQLLRINFDLSTRLVTLDPVLTGEGSATADDLAIMAEMMKAQLDRINQVL